MINSLIDFTKFKTKFKKSNEESKVKETIKKEKKQKLEEKKKKEQEQKAINELQTKWKYLMGQTDTFNKFKKSFGLNNIECTNYGFSLRIYAPTALYLDELEKLKPYIETEFACEFVYKIKYTESNDNAYADAKIIHPNKVKCNEIPFKPHKVKPYEFYAGIDVSGEPVVFNVNIAPQILLAGQTRRGKNGALDSAMVSWIRHCDEKEIQFYLFQCAKNDLIKYKDCKQVKCYVEGDLVQMYVTLEYVLKEMNKRKELFKEMLVKGDGNDNIFHYNNLHKNNKLPYIYIVIDEFIELMPDNELDDKNTKLLKNAILRNLQSIAQWGGSYGCNYIICHQKPEKALCPTFIKNQSSIRICFGFEDETCCQIVLGSGLMKMAHKLPPRKAFFTDNEKTGYLYTTDLKGRIRPNIEKAIKVGHRTIFDDLNKMGVAIESPFKDEKSKKDKQEKNNNNKQTEKTESTGKEDVSYEAYLKQKEEEIKKREEEVINKLKLIESKQKEIVKERELQKDDFSKIDKSLDQIVQENKSKIATWVEYQPVKSGKEKVK